MPFSDRYVAPKDPKSFSQDNLPDSEEELIEEERKQRSSLNQLHQQVCVFLLQIEELREMSVATEGKEEEIWDVQTAITLLSRKASEILWFQLKTLRGRRSESVETNASDGPSLEMFEEKQLLATYTALHEQIARYKADIIAVQNELLAASESSQQQLSPDEQYYWRNECHKEEIKRTRIVAQIVEERRQCCLLRAKLELKAIKHPTLLVTRF
ncbi:unnamed protein product [Anisakis simplex]|uniref:BMERB domain-containing protein n=1 Tax=Anisakis simplex TaxID=6269 RepID=A0A0M3JWV9_ANISI|nr:unnamed protein product [Anisakis simplex]